MLSSRCVVRTRNGDLHFVDVGAFDDVVMRDENGLFLAVDEYDGFDIMMGNELYDIFEIRELSLEKYLKLSSREDILDLWDEMEVIYQREDEKVDYSSPMERIENVERRLDELIEKMFNKVKTGISIVDMFMKEELEEISEPVYMSIQLLKLAINTFPKPQSEFEDAVSELEDNYERLEQQINEVIENA